MAWQLIYTSAPRLLEAGRSGFGTVARHRDIPPLVVAAVERISQFSRQSGLDSARVIYAHRILSISGQRFHVLSCTRDAGADYTGRTNHLAHHLIAESHEVAALEISSADVLMQMPWAAAWPEQPRWLEAQETIPLASFPSATGVDGAHWGAVTGNPRHAQLLASGDAAHRCYLVAPPDTDLRPLVAESLHLARERRWQVAFTTSLQPSDEPTDFRWLGIEAASPSRAATERSGRIVLDLTRPETLPALHSSAPAPSAVHIERAASPAPASLMETLPLSTAGTSAAAAPVFQNDRWARKKDEVFDTASARSASRKSSKWLWVSGATAAVIISMALGGVALYRSTTLKAERDNLVGQLPELSNIGPKRSTALEGLTWGTRKEAQRLASEADVLWNALETGKVDSIDPDPLQVAVVAAKEAGINVEAYQVLLGVARSVASQRDELRLAKTPDSSALVLDKNMWDKTLAAFPANLNGGDGLQFSRDALQGLFFEREGMALEAAFSANHDRQISVQTFKATVTALNEKLGKLTPPPALVRTSALVREWEQIVGNVQLEPRPEWPKWLREYARQPSRISDPSDVKLVEASRRSASPVDQLKVSSYLAVGLENLPDLTIRELGAKVKFQLIERGEASPSPLVAINNQSVRRTVDAPALFSIDAERQALTPEQSARTLRFPAILHLSNSEDPPTPIAEIHITSGKQKDPMFPPRTVGLSREGDTLLVDLSFVPGTAKARWLLQLPDAHSEEPLPIQDGVVQLSGVLRSKEQTTKDWQARLELKQKQLAELTNLENIEAKLARQCADLESLFSEAPKSEKGGHQKSRSVNQESLTRNEPPVATSALPRLGKLFQRLSNEIGDLANGDQMDLLFRCGVALEQPVGPESSAQLARANGLFNQLAGFKSEKARQQWGRKLEKLKEACETAMAMISIDSEESRREKARLVADITRSEKEIATLLSDPWQNGGTAAGDYLCLVEVGAQRVPITIFRIP